MSSERYRPVVAVVGYHLAPGRVARWPEGGYGVPGPYLDALRRADARPVILSPGEKEPEQLLAVFDGLLLVGGGDVEPSRYGAEPTTEHLYGIEPDRDELEIALLRAAARAAMPTLCICRGMQVMNVAFGGTLHQHLPDVPGLIDHADPLAETSSTHAVKPAARSRLAACTKSGSLTCSSHHHQGVDRLGDGLVATGWSEDGLVEAIELVVDRPWTDGWMVGIQWHPEDTAPTDPAQQSLFDGLALLARARGSKAKPGEREGRTRPYAVVPYDPAWSGRFEREAERIREALGDLVTRIDHVGSTAVRGLAAKPVVDIQVSVRTLEPREAYVDRLRRLGYRWSLDPIDDDHEYFSRDEDGERAFQVHVCPAGSAWERRHLLFRDHLRAHPETAAAYERLKRDLAARHPRDLFSYVDGKDDFIAEVEAGASGGDRGSRPGQDAAGAVPGSPG